MEEIEKINESVGYLKKFDGLIEKVVSSMLKPYGEDPLEFDEKSLNETEKRQKAIKLHKYGNDFLLTGNIKTAILYFQKCFEMFSSEQEYITSYLYALCNSPENHKLLLELSHLLPQIENNQQINEIKATIKYYSGDIESAYNIICGYIVNDLKFKSYSGNFIAGLVIKDAMPIKAKKYFQKAISLVGDSVEAHKSLFECHEKLEEFDEAEIEKNILKVIE